MCVCVFGVFLSDDIIIEQFSLSFENGEKMKTLPRPSQTIHNARDGEEERHWKKKQRPSAKV